MTIAVESALADSAAIFLLSEDGEPMGLSHRSEDGEPVGLSHRS
jgi:hypothetical protein